MACVTIRFLHHLLIYVSSLDRAVAFYSGLGMEPIASLSSRIRWMRIGPNELHLMQSDEPWQRFRDEPSPHFAIECDDIAQAQSVIPTLGGEILQQIQTRPHDGSLYLFALDPDGNRFELTQHLEDWHRRFGLIEDLKRRGALRSARVEGAMRGTPRHLFLPGKPLAQVYADEPILTREEGESRSSCSQPSMVAIMLEALELQGGEQVLEIGAGTGWNAALMSALVGQAGSITTIDIDEETVESARSNLKRAQSEARIGAENVRVIQADGGWGWPQDAPYEAIVATCGVSDIAPPWVEQLRDGGRLVAPLWFNTAQFCGAWEKRGATLVSSRLSWAGFMPLRGHFATARQIEQDGAWFHFDEMHGLDISALRALLDAPAREVEVPEMPSLQVGSAFLEYAALRGQPLLMAKPPGAPQPYFALSVAPDSLLILDARPRLYGSEASLDRLRELLRDWEAAGRPGMQQARITAALRGTLATEAGAFLVRKTWMDYVVRFEAKAD